MNDTIVIGFILYTAIGALASWWYMRKIDSLVLETKGRHAHKAVSGIAGGCMVFGWLILLPYELATNFKDWR